jgi:alpha-glucosidase
MIMNSWKPDEVYTSPWLHPESTPAIRAAIRLRYRLMPYLYALMHKASLDGTPPLLPTCAVFPNDDGTHFDSPDLMLGSFLLAAPVVEQSERSREVYLPAGPECWFDFWSGERLPSGQFATLAAPLDRLPLVVASGGILPMTDSLDFSRLHDEPSRCLRLYPGPGTGTSHLTLVEDDGITASGPTTRIEITMSWSATDVMVRADVKGDFPLPFDAIGVSLPESDQRALHVGDLLTIRPFQA